MSKRSIRVAIGAVFLAGLCAVAFMLYRTRQQNLAFNTHHDLVGVCGTVVGMGLVPYARVDFPRGDIRSLYEWVLERSRADPVSWGFPQHVVDSEQRLFVDAWGQPLVYRYPPRQSRDILFELYSVGPNGIDERGQGDDISVSEALVLRHWFVQIRDGRMSCEWFWEHVDELVLDERLNLVRAP